MNTFTQSLFCEDCSVFKVIRIYISQGWTITVNKMLANRKMDDSLEELSKSEIPIC